MYIYTRRRLFPGHSSLAIGRRRKPHHGNISSIMICLTRVYAVKVIILSIGLRVTWTIIISMNIACFATRGVCEFIGVAHTACHLPDIILRTLSCCAARAVAIHHYMTPPVEGRLPAIARSRPTPVRAPSWEHYYDYLHNLCICCYICMGEVLLFS